jgi:fused signal recognition particle receptor
MFKFLKEKLMQAAAKFTKQVKDTVEEAPEEEEKPKKVQQEKKEEKKQEQKQAKKEEKKPEKKEEKKPEKKQEKAAEKKEEKKEDKKEIRKEEKKPEVKKEEKKPDKKEPKPEIKEKEEIKEEAEEKKGFFGRLKDKFTWKKEEQTEEKEELKQEKSEPKKEEKKEKPAEKPVEHKPAKKAEIKKEEPIEETPVFEPAELTEEAEPEEPAAEETEEEVQEQTEEIKEETAEEEPEEKVEEKKGFFGRIADKITKTTISEEKFNDLFWDLELALLETNVAVEVIEKIKQDMSSAIVNVPISRKGIDEMIKDSLTKSIRGLFDVEPIDLVEKAKQKTDKPFIVAFVGVNGVGKTTTIAKVANLFEKNHLRCVLAAADTFRTAAIEQLEEHANNLGIKIIKHEYGSDCAAVAFDAIKHAQSMRKEVVLIDTAGRTHVNKNLMDELKKLIRVSKPDVVVFIGDSLTGNDAVEQAKEFNDAVGIDGVILAKADVDEKGGAAISISYVIKKPIMYLGTGQTYDDLKKFTPELIFENLGLESEDSS